MLHPPSTGVVAAASQAVGIAAWHGATRPGLVDAPVPSAR